MAAGKKGVWMGTESRLAPETLQRYQPEAGGEAAVEGPGLLTGELVGDNLFPQCLSGFQPVEFIMEQAVTVVLGCHGPVTGSEHCRETAAIKQRTAHQGGDTPRGPGFTILGRGGSKKPRSVNYESQWELEWGSLLREGRDQVWRRKPGQKPRHTKGRSESLLCGCPQGP